MFKKIVKYISPLSVFSLISFSLAMYCFTIPNEEGWSQMLAILILLFVSLPAIAINGIINNLVKTKKNNIVIQLLLIAAAVVVVVSTFFR